MDALYKASRRDATFIENATSHFPDASGIALLINTIRTKPETLRLAGATPLESGRAGR